MTTPPAVPRIVVPDPAGTSLERHLQLYGPMPAITADGTLIDAVASAGLRGRGGGWFPTATKMRTVEERGGRFLHRPVVVANSMEGEPLSQTDEWLALNAPHLVLDGLEAAAIAINAHDCAIAVHEGTPQAASLREAVAARPPAAVALRVVEAPGRYVASEESALARFVGGGPEMPVFGARPHEYGVGGHPTLVNNAETLADIALIARFGAEWFAQVGTESAPGTVLISLGGAVVAPGEYEVPVGTTPAQIIAAAGGSNTPVTGILTGGYGGTWALPDDIMNTPWAPDQMRQEGAAIGAGVLWLHPEGRCGIRETARIANYLAGESAGQCGVCTFGLSTIAADLEALAACRLDEAGVARLQARMAAVPRRGGCGLPDGAVRMYQSAMSVFATEVTAHAAGSCLSDDDPTDVAWLPVPTPRPHPVIAAGKDFR